MVKRCTRAALWALVVHSSYIEVKGAIEANLRVLDYCPEPLNCELSPTICWCQMKVKVTLMVVLSVKAQKTFGIESICTI